MVRPFRLNRQAVEHPRLADSEIADIDHLLHFAFAFGDDFAGLEGDELAKLRLQIAQRVSELAHGFATDWPWSDAPLLERLLGSDNSPLVFGIGRSANAPEEFAVDRGEFFDHRAAAEP